MLPFTVDFKGGQSVSRQVVYAVKKAVVSGQLQPGDRFPSVRTLSQELKINPNTAHRIVADLVSDGLLKVEPGIGTTVAQSYKPTRARRRALLEEDAERLVVEAKRLGLELQEVVDAVTQHWNDTAKEGS